MAVKDARDIGFYHCLEREGRTFHLQTELFGSQPVQIKTTVIEGGAILDAQVQPLSPGQSLEQAEAAAQQQHDVFLSKVQAGVYG